MLETAVGDEHNAVEVCLLAIGFGAPLTAHGAVLVDERTVATIGTSRTTFLGSCGAGDGDAANRGHYVAAAFTEPVLWHGHRAASHTRHLPTAHSLVLGRTAFAFSTKSIRAHTSVVSCASAR